MHSVYACAKSEGIYPWIIIFVFVPCFFTSITVNHAVSLLVWFFFAFFIVGPLCMSFSLFLESCSISRHTTFSLFDIIKDIFNLDCLMKIEEYTVLIGLSCQMNYTLDTWDKYKLSTMWNVRTSLLNCIKFTPMTSTYVIKQWTMVNKPFMIFYLISKIVHFKC